MPINVRYDIADFIEKNRLKYGIPKMSIKALKEFGIYDARALTVLTETDYCKIPMISERTAQALCRASQDMYRGELFQSVEEYWKNQLQYQKSFTSGSKGIDTLLEGGFRTGMLTEIVGEYRSGKTQTCMTAAVTAQMPVEKGGLDSPVIYITTNSYFHCEHYLRIGKRFEIAEEKLLSNVFIVQAEQMRNFQDAIDRLPGYMQAFDARLVIIDSLIAPFESRYRTINETIIMQKHLQSLLAFLKRLAIGFNCAIIFTNHVIANHGFSQKFLPIKPAGGEAIEHASDMRLFLRKLKDNCRRMKVDSCSFLPCEDTEFYLTNYGIADEETIDLPERKEEEEEEETKEEEIKAPLLAGIKEVAERKKRK